MEGIAKHWKYTKLVLVLSYSNTDYVAMPWLTLLSLGSISTVYNPGGLGLPTVINPSTFFWKHSTTIQHLILPEEKIYIHHK